MTDVFCKILANPDDSLIGQTEHFVIFDEARPVSPGHCMIVSKTCDVDAFALSAEQWADFPQALALAKTLVEKNYQPDGYNVGANCGKAAGQTQMHFHAHVIPRYTGDVDNPVGGVRNIFDEYVAPKLPEE